MYECQNCGAEWEQDDLNPIQDIDQRVLPGEFMPGGECPECGAVCHSEEEIIATVKRMFGMREIDWPTFQNERGELEQTIDFLENKGLTDEHNIKALRGVLSTLNELQAQAVRYGYTNEEVYG